MTEIIKQNNAAFVHIQLHTLLSMIVWRHLSKALYVFLDCCLMGCPAPPLTHHCGLRQGDPCPVVLLLLSIPDKASWNVSLCEIGFTVWHFMHIYLHWWCNNLHAHRKDAIVLSQICINFGQVLPPISKKALWHRSTSMVLTWITFFKASRQWSPLSRWNISVFPYLPTA